MAKRRPGYGNTPHRQTLNSYGRAGGYSPLKHQMFLQGHYDVRSPWSNGFKFKSYTLEGDNVTTNPGFNYNKESVEQYIQEVSKVAKDSLNLEDMNIEVAYGLQYDEDGNLVTGTYFHNDNKIVVYPDNIYQNGVLNNEEYSQELFEKDIRKNIGHESKHQWQNTKNKEYYDKLQNDYYEPETGGSNNYNDDFNKYYNEPVEKEARYFGDKFNKGYDSYKNQYLEKMNQQNYDDEIFRKKLNEIEGRPKTPKTPKTKNKRPELKKPNKSLRPTVTMNGNNVEIDSIYNHSTPKSVKKEKQKSKKKYESRSRTFQADDGSRVKQYLDKDGNIRAQVREWSDGRREVRRQHTAKTIAKDPLAKNMSAASSMYDGETTEIHKRPNGDYYTVTNINHQTGEVVTTRNKRNHKWGGGIMGSETVRTTIEEQRQAHYDYMNKKYGLEDMPDTPEPEIYSPEIGDNIIDNETGERYVLREIDHANPDLDIHSDRYYYDSPNGERITRQTPIDPNDADGRYSLGDNILNPKDVHRINSSFEDLRMYTDDLDEAKGRLNALKDAFDDGADNLDEIYEMEKSVRSLESKVANARMQIEEDNNRYNSNGNSAYEINEKTQRYMDKADDFLKDYSETKYVNNYEDVFKESMPRQFINTIEPGVDSAIEIINSATVENNVKARTMTRGKKKNAQLTGRGGKKISVESTGRGGKKVTASTGRGGRRKSKTVSTSTGRRKLKKVDAPGRGGKATKLRAVGKNGKVLSNIPRKALKNIPLTKKDIVETAANLVINEAATNTASAIIKNIDDINPPDVDNAPNPDSSNIPSEDNPIPEPDHSNTPDPEFEVPDGYGGPETWTDEDIADMADGDPDLYDELMKRRDQALNIDTPTPEPEQTGPQGKPLGPKPFSDGFDPSDPDTWTRDDIKRMNDPSSWSNDDIKRLADGDMDYTKELLERRRTSRKGLESGPKQGPDDFRFHTDDAPIPDFNDIDAPDTKMFDEDGLPQGLSKMDIAMTGLNIIGAIGDYKDARRQGHGVVSSAVRAGAKFAIDEALGWWALPIGIVKSLPGAAIKGADMLYKENRRMNSAANFQVFGDAQFMDTQQLATMRQSGMEMAKMAQYNLQQTLMGSEAKYLHR